jgi:tetratricopeptide (TPR) repeat protein
MARSYHQLGMVAQERGQLPQAEQWYRKSLEIEEALGNRSGMAASYHELGRVAQRRGQLPQAEQWYRKSLEIEEALGNRRGMASSYGQLGLLAERNQDPAAALDWIVRCGTVRAISRSSDWPGTWPPCTPDCPVGHAGPRVQLDAPDWSITPPTRPLGRRRDDQTIA